MSKLSDDHIRWVLDMDAKGVQAELTKLSSQSQKFIDDNKRMNSELRATERQMKEAEKTMNKLTEAGKSESNQFRDAEIVYNSAAKEAAFYRKQIKENTLAIEENRKKHNEAIKTMRIEDMTMEQLAKRANSLSYELNRTSKATSPDAYNALNRELIAVKNRMGELKKGSDETGNSLGKMGSAGKGALAVFAGNMMTKAVELFGELLRKAKDFVVESVNMATAGEGVKRAFDALGKAGLLDRLREQTRGTISDLKLMEATVKADKYKIPLEDVGNLLEFAGRRAVDMGKDIDDFQRRIIEGIGKQSKVVLDDLGLSGAEINKAIAKEGSFTKGVISIVNEEIEKQGKVALTAADRAQQASVKWENAQLKLGNQLLVVKNIWSAISGETAGFLSKFIDKYAPQLTAWMQHFINSTIDMYNNSLGVRLVVQGLVTWWKTLFQLFKLNIKNTVTSLEFLGNIIKAAFTLDTDAMKKSITGFMKSIVDNGNNFKDAMVDNVKTFMSAKDEMAKPVDFSEFMATMSAMSKDVKKNTEDIVVDAKTQKKNFNLLLESMEASHQKKLADIRQEYLDGKITSESEYNNKIFSQEQAYYLLREQALSTYLSKVTDKETKSDITKQIASLQNERLNREVKFRADLEKIILEANPVEKEKQEYANRLRELGLYGESAKTLQLAMMEASTHEEKARLQQKYDAFILLEQQYNDNMFKIRKDRENKNKQQSEDEFEKEFGDKRKSMQESIATDEQNLQLNTGFGVLSGNAAFEAEVALHQKKMDLIQKEIEARNSLGLTSDKQIKELQKKELDLTNLYVKEFNRRKQEYSKYGQEIGNVLGQVISGQENAVAAFSSVMLDILFDTLTQIINAEIAKVVATATGAIARTTAEQVASKGFLGIGTAAILTGVITGAMTVAKTALKGMLSNKGSSSSSSSTSTSSTSTSSTSYRRVRKSSDGYAEGGYYGGYTGDGDKYDIKGYFQNGEPYHAGEYIIPKEIMPLPTIAPMVRKIEATRRMYTDKNPLPEGFAAGGYNGNLSQSSTGSLTTEVILSQLYELLNDLKDNPIRANVNIREFNEKQDRLNQSQNLGKAL